MNINSQVVERYILQAMSSQIMKISQNLQNTQNLAMSVCMRNKIL